MRKIQLALISICILFLIATGISLLFPSTVVVSRAVDIKSDKGPVFAMVSNIYQWKNWVEGMNASVVKIYNADSAQLGKTTVKIVSVTDTTVVSNWQTPGSEMQESTLRLITDTNQHVTVVQWQFVQNVNWYPWEKFASMMNDKIIGTMIEKNLQTLKGFVERN